MIASFLARRRARRHLQRDVAIFYHPGYANAALVETARTAGLDPFRGETILGILAREGLLRAEDLRVPRRVSLPTLKRLHPEAYLEEVTSAATLAHIFGLREEAIDVEGILQAQRLAAGGTVAAARLVHRGHRRVAFNLGGGFHHAAPEQGSGFCVYNDIAAAIASVREREPELRVAIVDLDYHQGNGNLLAFAADPRVLTLSLHGSVWAHVEAVGDVSLTLPPGTDDATYLAALDQTLLPALERHAPRLIFFIAGNDVLEGDRLGDFQLTPDGVFERDRRVVDAGRALGLPMVITLGGGYQPAAALASTRLATYLLTDRSRPRPPRSRDDPRRRFRQIYRKLEPGRLQTDASDALELDFSDVLDDLSADPPARRFLDFYTVPGAEYALERYGILEKIREHGYRDLVLSGDLRDRGHQILRLHGVGRHDPERHPLLLVELVAYLSTVSPPALPRAHGLKEDLKVLWVEWLLLQHPLASFSLERPRLPGQKHPGLGIAADVVLALTSICHRLDLDGLLHRPAHFHNAAIGARHFRFLDPEMEGRFRALREVLEGQAGLSLADASEAVDAGLLRLADGTPLVWDAAPFYLPVSERLRGCFDSAEYRAVSEKARADLLAAGLQ